jgi:hypothetical protein
MVWPRGYWRLAGWRGGRGLGADEIQGAAAKDFGLWGNRETGRLLVKALRLVLGQIFPLDALKNALALQTRGTSG